MKALFTLLFLAMTATFTFANSGQMVADGVEGTWSYSVETPDGVYQGKLVFTKDDDGYSGKLITPNGEAPMKNLKVDGNKFSFSAEAEGYYVDIKGKVEGDSLTADVGVEDNYLVMTGKRE